MTLRDPCDTALVRDDVIETFQRYIATGCPMGSFCEAVVCNDLKQAVQRADDYNLRTLPAVVAWLYNNAPMGCWGSPAAFKAWTEQGGLNGLIAEEL